MKIERIEKLSRCPAAVMLGAEGHLDLLRRGWTEECSSGLGYDHKALLAFLEEKAVGLLTFQEVEWRNTLTIEIGYVAPEHRRQGVYQALWEELLTYAREKGFRRIMGTTHRDNRAMQAVMEKLNRQLTWLGYEYRVPELMP